MKYVMASAMLVCLVGMFAFIQLGANYLDPNNGYGLHPVAAFVGALFLFVVGVWASGQIED